MANSWPDSTSPSASCHPAAQLPPMHTPNAEAQDTNIRNMLSDLPAFGGFTEFVTSLPADSFVQYLATDVPHPECIKNERTRSLIRALRAKSDKRDQKRIQKRDRKRPAPDPPVGIQKRPRWTQLGKERKQACIRVALAAACKYARVGDRVYKLRKVWQENPRRKQMINADVRSALAESVSQWSDLELRAYLDRAGPFEVKTRESMVTAVREHLAPEVETHAQ